MLRSRPANPALGRQLAEVFGHIYVINLASRADRRREIDAQLALVGLGLDHPSVTLFAAVRPTDAGEWPSIGARGCFLSHLGVLRAARAAGLGRLLILEDDIDWTRSFLEHGARLIAGLASQNWGYVHGGIEGHATGPSAALPVAPETELLFGQFVGLRGDAIARAEACLAAMTTRRAGDPAGGPMHVDGAYVWFRRNNPDIDARILHPPVCYQRPSRTDIHDLRWFDRTPVVAPLVAACRRLRNIARRPG